ncbi:ATP-binding protein [Pareuzebyella sediminis]|uniref:ATP-binding protein n=1 Tax=Pareuzebyella sediminis TaxID=2607998 RepID=UPI0018E19F72|nr:sensor histidine kinase [Pareuzebyella sediminis]
MTLDKAQIWRDRIDSINLQPNEKAKFYYLSARIYQLNNQADRAYDFFLKSKSLYTDLDSLALVADINLKLAQMISALKQSDLKYQPFLDAYLDYAKTQNNPKYFSKAYMTAGSILIDTLPNETLRYYKLALKENAKTEDELFKSKVHHNLAVLHSEHLEGPDSAFFYFDCAYKTFSELGQSDYMAYVHIGRASLLRRLNRYDEAVREYQIADTIPLKNFRRNAKSLLHGYMSDAYAEGEDYENAYKFLQSHMQRKDSIDQAEQNIRISEIQTKYEVEKKENENLKLKQNRNWLIAGLAVAVLLIGLSYLGYSNQKKRKLLIQKENQVQTERLDALLKEQELMSLDAMVAGQEKERQRIANDLHDNLGSILATIKLHFQNLKIKKDRLKEQEDKLIQKTDELIEEAYQKVRSIAHAKNVGLRAKEGLLPAIKNFASKVSLANKLVIEVEDHGMEERLENSLEITLFRIIQELITNVVKHSKATESTIHITHHDQNINIMVEDNGVGFDTDDISEEDGMGIYSIQKRVENLDGSLTIDSIVDKGTSVIIDIPLI